MPNKARRDLTFEKLGYVPSDAQRPVHDSDARIKLVAGGERSGKSYLSAMEYMGRFWETPLLWLVAADYERTRAEFNYICESFDKLELEFEATKHVDPGEIIVLSKEGSIALRVATKSSKDPRKLAVEAPDAIIGCEASQLDFETYLRIRGRLAEKRGWGLLSGTFESSLGWYPEMYNRGLMPTADFASFSMPTWTNTVIFPGGRQDPEILSTEAEMPADWFLERFGGVPCPPKGMVFTEFRNAIHTGVGGDFEFDPAQEVYIFVDPGFATAYAVLAVQKRGEHLYIVDEIFEKGFVTYDIINICKQKPWYNKIIGGAIDIAARQHQAQPAVAEVWLKESGIPLMSQKLAIRDTVEVVKRYLLLNPITNSSLLHINAKVKGLISEMGGCPNPITGQTAVYRWQHDKDGNIVSNDPVDKNNHACKALAYGIINLFGYSTAATRKAKTTFV